jgi:hypothetical protein
MPGLVLLALGEIDCMGRAGSKRGLGIVVAARELHQAGSRRRVVMVRLGTPRRAARGEYWECPYQIVGLGHRETKHAQGEDGIQALLLAIESVRTTLKKSGKQFSWIGGEPGDTGFTCIVPTFFGPGFSKRLELMIEREVDRFARTMERRHRRRTAKR